MLPAHIQVNGLRAGYDGTEVLHGLDFQVNRGEFVSIVGKSGCGKSTLLYALAGFIRSEGRVGMPSDVGVVFQSYAVFPWLTVAGNIGFGLHKLPAEEKRRLVAGHLELIGLQGEARKFPGQLSGGQAQRVALARALAPDPEVILMDEPFGALDMYTRERMQSWLLDVWERDHKTVVFVTHNIEEAVFLSDRVIVLGLGVILGEFPVGLARPRAESVKFTPSLIELKQQIRSTMEQPRARGVPGLPDEDEVEGGGQ
jgi:NitT/TauT family transport system ATP-binding protein